MTDFFTYTDESGNEPYFVVGGLTSTEPKWAALEAEWPAMLEAPPAIPYFKFNKTHRLSAVQHGAKIEMGIALINKYVLRADATIVDVGEYEVYFRNLIGASHDNPRLMAYTQTIMQAALHCPEPDGRMNFIFDTIDDVQLAELQHWFEMFRKDCPNADVKARLCGEPVCMDDKTTSTLQAADLWAGVASASVQKDDKDAAAFLRKISIPNRAYLWNQDNLVELLSRTVKRTPDIVTRKYYESKKQRKRRLKEWLLGRGER